MVAFEVRHPLKHITKSKLIARYSGFLGNRPIKIRSERFELSSPASQAGAPANWAAYLLLLVVVMS